MNGFMKHTVETGIEMLYRGQSLEKVAFDDKVVEQFNKYAEELGLTPIHNEISTSRDFLMPDAYKKIDIDKYIKNLTPNNKASIARVATELTIYKEKNLYPVLQLMIYLVDVMRKNNILWGIGRGSSVASYVLFLIGIHRVDSLRYNLDINEFLK